MKNLTLCHIRRKCKSCFPFWLSYDRSVDLPFYPIRSIPGSCIPQPHQFLRLQPHHIHQSILHCLSLTSQHSHKFWNMFYHLRLWSDPFISLSLTCLNTDNQFLRNRSIWVDSPLCSTFRAYYCPTLQELMESLDNWLLLPDNDHALNS